ncbi:MAG: GSCFA domain-containing protein [Bacteroidota bacterium]|nr:GSCFA domain-containing protein [Bacteroidota bacterium]
MRWHTETRLPDFPFKLNLKDPVLFLGSCFAENISDRFNARFLPNVRNPFGIIFNPLVLDHLVEKWIAGVQYSKSDLRVENGVWFSFDHHSRFSHHDPSQVLENISGELERSRHYLTQFQAIFITLGTSFYWRLKEGNRLVNNCHKVPAKEFKHQMAEIDEMVSALNNTISLYRGLMPKVPIILTVSPVRHLRQGSIDNQRSKSRLIEVCHQLASEKNVHYFPAYELMMDDLREYRFYKSDLIHPNDEAIQYIWENVVSSFFSEQETVRINDLERLSRGLGHQPFQSGGKEYAKHLKRMEALLDKIEEKSGHSFPKARICIVKRADQSTP